MEEKHPARKASILEAARSLGVSTKTIQRYLAKGLLTKVREGGRTYVLMSDLHLHTVQGQRTPGPEIPSHAAQDLERPLRDTVILDREHYDGLLMELAELRRLGERDLHDGGTSAELQVKIAGAEVSIKDLHQRIDALESRLSLLERTVSESSRVQVEREDAAKPSKPPKPWWQK